MTAGPVLLIKVNFIQSCREFLGGLSPCCFKTGGALAPSAPPVPPPMFGSEKWSILENIQLLIPLIAIKTQLSNYKSTFINALEGIITQESSVKKMLTRN